MTLVDSMEYKNAMNYQLGGMATQNPVPFENVTICTKKILVEICTVDQTTDSVYLSVELLPHICYLEHDDPMYSPSLEQNALLCAISDYPSCRNNVIEACKFIDCYNSQIQTQSPDLDKRYLFSACVPRVF